VPEPHAFTGARVNPTKYSRYTVISTPKAWRLSHERLEIGKSNLGSSHWRDQPRQPNFTFSMLRADIAHSEQWRSCTLTWEADVIATCASRPPHSSSSPSRSRRKWSNPATVRRCRMCAIPLLENVDLSHHSPTTHRYQRSEHRLCLIFLLMTLKHVQVGYSHIKRTTSFTVCYRNNVEAASQQDALSEDRSTIMCWQVSHRAKLIAD
jgi:hypothetical protein